MNLKKVVQTLNQAENELMAQIGRNELDYGSLQALMGLSQEISSISYRISQYIDEDFEDDYEEPSEDPANWG